jgi:mono/diheme cytochrome c family protein
MRTKLALFAVAATAIAALAADQATLEAGRKAEQTGCVPCHSLRLVDSQRLSRAAWDRELTKMAGWGWAGKPEERAALLEYLVANFGDDKPAAPPEKSADGRK